MVAVGWETCLRRGHGTCAYDLVFLHYRCLIVATSGYQEIGTVPGGSPAITAAVFRAVRTGNAFRETVERLLEGVKLGVYAPGDRLPPERELTRRLGISPITLRETPRELAGGGDGERGRVPGAAGRPAQRHPHARAQPGARERAARGHRAGHLGRRPGPGQARDGGARGRDGRAAPRLSRRHCVSPGGTTPRDPPDHGGACPPAPPRPPEGGS